MDSKDPSKWGENLLGKALMNIRDVLKKEMVPLEAAMPSEAAMTSDASMPSEAAMPLEAAAAPSRKKSRGKPTVGTLAPAAEVTVPSTAIVQEAPIEEQPIAPQVALPQVAPQTISQGGAPATKRTLRMSGKRKNNSPSA
jgi:hypothetical protein